MSLKGKLFNSLGILWLSLVIIVCGLSVYIGARFDSSMMALLPESEQQPIVQIATEQMSDRFSKRLILMLSAKDDVSVRKTIPILAHHLKSLPEIAEIDWQVTDVELESIQNELYPYRFSVLDQGTRSLLLNGDFKEIQDRALIYVYSPLLMGKKSLIGDPFSLFSELNQNRKSDLKIQVSGSLLKAEAASEPTYLMVLILSDQPFSPTTQRNVLTAINSHKAMFTSEGIGLQMSGMLIHADQAARQANGEIFTIGAGSMIGIIILMILVFKQLKPVFLIFIPLIVGCVMAVSVTLFVFGKIHLITIAFGAGLVGVSIDYTLHFLCERRISSATDVLQKILPGLLLGLFSSVMAYAAQAMSPFPGLQQMAVFSAVGLMASWLTVVLWFPLLTKHDAINPLLAAKKLNGLRDVFSRIGKNKIMAVLVLIALVLSLKMISNSDSLDDIRLLQVSSGNLLEQEKGVQEVLGSSSSSQFLLIGGSTIEESLQKEERVIPLLDKLVEKGLLQGYQALSQQLPSLKRQTENTKFIQRLYEKQLTPLYGQIGLNEKKIPESLAEFNRLRSFQLSPEVWLQQKISKPWRDQLIVSDDGLVNATIVRFLGPMGDDTKEALTSVASEEGGVEFIDQIQGLTDLMARFRAEITSLVMSAYLLVFLVLFARYKKKVWRIVLPPLLASIFTLALIVNFEQGVNIFHLMALILVLGIGLDMGIFLSESSDYSHTWLAVSMSSLTSLFAFGLLTFSETPVLHHFGLTVLIGLTLVWLLAPMMRESMVGEKI